MKHKLINLIILLLLPLVLVGCFRTPVVNQNVNQNTNTEIEEIDTSDWQTYRNEEYGFEFKYPGDWEIITLLDGRLSLKPIGKKGYEYVGDIIITVNPINLDTSIKDFYSEKNLNPFNLADFLINQIGDYEVYIFKALPGMVSSDLYVFIIDKHVLEFTIYNSQEKIADKIIENTINF